MHSMRLLCVVVSLGLSWAAPCRAQSLAQTSPQTPIDFSYAGYGGGGVAFPAVKIVRSLGPSGGDDTSRIQSALEAVGYMTPNKDGVRGAVLLRSGRFIIKGTLYLNDSGVVLRGSGSGPTGTHLEFVGEPRTGIVMQGGGQAAVTARTQLVGRSVAPGEQTLTVADGSVLAAGQTVRILRPLTETFLRQLWPEAQRVGNRYVPGWHNALQRFERTIIQIAGNDITLDAPLTDAIPVEPQASEPVLVMGVTWPSRLRHAAVERLSAHSPIERHDAGAAMFRLIAIDSAEDVFVSEMRTGEFQGGIVDVGSETRRITIQNISSRHSPVRRPQGRTPIDFRIAGSQILLQSLSVEGDDRLVVAMAPHTTGPNVARQIEAFGNAHTLISPAAPWCTGVLFENIYLPGGTIGLGYGPLRSGGKGWLASNALIYNSTALQLAVSPPPVGSNFCVGGSGRAVGDPRSYLQVDQAVEPDSLYFAQLAARLGQAAVDNTFTTLPTYDAARPQSIAAH